MTRCAAKRGEPEGQRLTRADRMRRRREFLAVQRQGVRVHTSHFILVVRPSPRQRLGVTVTKKVACAVGRNRVKRLAREVFRRNRSLFPPETDVVLVARKGADGLDYRRLLDEISGARSALLQAARRAQAPRPRKRSDGRKEPRS